MNVLTGMHLGIVLQGAVKRWKVIRQSGTISEIAHCAA